MASRIELAGSIAAVILDVLALLLLLFAPLVPICTQSGVTPCPAASVRNVTLPQAGVTTLGWVLVFGLFALILAAAAGAFAEARSGARWGTPALWACGALAFAICALGAGGIGPIYFPAMLAVLVAAFASISGRVRPNQGVQPNVDRAGQRPISGGNGPTS